MTSQNPREVGGPTHRLRFTMPACGRHFFKGHKWWCRACDQQTESEMRDAVHELWRLQGAGDRIDYPDATTEEDDRD